MQHEKVINYIVNWLKDYCLNAKLKGFVIGVSGGIDSALTSTLVAKTGLPVWALNMPIRQAPDQVDRSDEQIEWLKSQFDQVIGVTQDLTPVFESLEATLPKDIQDGLTMANSRSRLRMVTLYAYAGHHKALVAGTGNKVEDFGVGFYTKYGDGGVDLSPIADLKKSEVYELAKYLDIPMSIQKAAPTDGLWDDARTDEGQIGATYDELEWAMDFIERDGDESSVTARQQEVLSIYRSFHNANKHKMVPIPVCDVPDEWL